MNKMEKTSLQRRTSIILLSVMVLYVNILAVMPMVSALFNWNDNSLVAYYNFSEGSGTATKESTGKYNGTLNDSRLWSNGFFINDYSINSSIGYVNITTNFSSLLPQNYTFSLWINEKSSLNDVGILGLGDTDHRQIWLFTSSSQQIQLSSYIGGVNRGLLYLGVVNGRWEHYVGRYNSTNVTFFRNGTIISGQGATGLLAVGGSPFNAFIGKIGNYGTFNGSIDEVGIWNRSLSDSEILELYHFGNGLHYGSSASFIENSQTYNNQTTEGNTETFLVNITYDNINFSNIIPYLVYNNTNYLGSVSSGGDNIIISKSLAVPQVSANINISFYWNIGLINSTGTTYYNSTANNQSVANLGISSDCSAYTVLVLNYTMKDERTQAFINSTIYNASIELDMQIYPLGSDTLILNLSRLYNSSDISTNKYTAQVCLQSNLTSGAQYRMYTQAKYSADSYVTRYNYLQNFTLKNSTIPQNIILYDLQSASNIATKFLITYKDSTFLAVSNALITISRKYISEGVFKTVEIEKTDSLGQAYAYFDLNGVQYTIIVTKEGRILSTFDNIAIFCEDTITGNCKINLDASSSFIPAVNFYTYSNLIFIQDFNSSTRIYNLIFNTVDSSVALVSINLTKFDMYGNTSLCSNSVSTSSGSLSCTIPSSYNNVTFTVIISINNIPIATSIFSIMPSAVSSFVGNIFIFVLLLVMCIGLMFLPSAIGLVIGTTLGVGVASVLFFIEGNIIGGGAFMLLVIAGAIIIWRIRQGGSD